MSFRAIREGLPDLDLLPPPAPETVACQAAERFQTVVQLLLEDLRDKVSRAGYAQREHLTNAFVFHLGQLYNRYRKEAPKGHTNDAGATMHVCVADVMNDALDVYDVIVMQLLLPPRLHLGPSRSEYEEAEAPVRLACGIEVEVPQVDPGIGFGYEPVAKG